ncbi:MAG: hypothetical protein HY303_15405 [Candidatus Wallbacteria bacterium]|nr:hypothetical protein [Candidatus Wallbacteria bacterium]
MRWLLVMVLALASAGPARAQYFRLDLGSGPNLVSLPRSAVATTGYTASQLAADTGASLLMTLGSPRRGIFLPGIVTATFQFEPDRALLVVVPSARTVTLHVPRDLASSLPAAQLTTLPGQTPLGLPLFGGARASLDASALTTLTGARVVIRTRRDPSSGQSFFEEFAPLGGTRGFTLDPGRGYLLSLPPDAPATTFALYLSNNGLPDTAPALSGGPAGDADGDGLSNLEEVKLGTNPLSANTDSDGVPDGFEVLHGTDPFDSASRPPLPRVDSLDVTQIRNDQGGDLSITGANFDGATAARLSDPATTLLQSFTLASTTRITAHVQTGIAAGTYDVRVTSPAGTNQTSAVRLTIASPPPPPVSFATDVYPIFRNRCVQCHVPGGIGNGLWADPNPQNSYSSIQSHGVADTVQPTQSLLLLKPLAPSEGGLGMNGGFTVIFQHRTDPDWQTILRWIQEGAKNN